MEFGVVSFGALVTFVEEMLDKDPKFKLAIDSSSVGIKINPVGPGQLPSTTYSLKIEFTRTQQQLQRRPLPWEKAMDDTRDRVNRLWDAAEKAEAEAKAAAAPAAAPAAAAAGSAVAAE